ncbi:MarR family winged helix-turn-helix transcriptional regulator [Saccharomonospora azurea]|uniref:MarR family winged helix-turn-helix transcriptional regulator n=1 Tax=Saccharomonospora azurea TaxID=40988 RepID=UPI003D90D9A6
MDRTPDLIAVARDQWRAVHPDTDTSSMDVVGRVLRAAAVLRRRLDAVLADDGLNRAEFDLLCALRRSGAALTAGQLNEQTLSSGAATTKRLHHLAERGLLRRTVDEHDKRVARVQLTELGREVIDRAFHRNLAAERRLLDALPEAREDELTRGLADLLRALEGPSSG